MRHLTNIITELNRIFELLNKKYYGDLLPKPIINIQTNGKKKNVLGWITTKKVWKDTTGDKYYEITICSEFLHRSIEEICCTLLHEMAHLYCLENGIKDVSRSGTYHNKKFKEVAETKGLIIGFNKRIGHSPSTLNDESSKYINKIARRSVFTISRNNNILNAPKGVAGKDSEKKKSSLKYLCPNCKNIVRATKTVNIVCGDCNKEFIEQ